LKKKLKRKIETEKQKGMENLQASPNPLLLSTAFDKDVEIQSTSSSTEQGESYEKKERGPLRDGSGARRDATDEEVDDKEGVDSQGDREANEEGRKEGLGLGLGLGIVARMTRTSTKSSWKDPGPPPDGGWNGWTQGTLKEIFMFA
jgi:hypothetical protein